MLARLSQRLTYANVMATLAVFMVLGGGAYAASQLRSNSVGSRQLRNNAVSSPKVKDGSLLRKDFKRGEVPAGPQGLVGPKGSTGAQGPGTKTYDGQHDYSPTYLPPAIPIGNGLELLFECDSTQTSVIVQRASDSTSFYGFGTASDGNTVTPPQQSIPPGKLYTQGNGATRYLDVIAAATAPGTPVRYSRIDASVVRGSKCNYHALVIPPS